VLPFLLRRSIFPVAVDNSVLRSSLLTLLPQTARKSPPANPSTNPDPGGRQDSSAKSDQKPPRGLTARQILARFEALSGTEEERWDKLFAEFLFSDNELAGAVQQLHEQGKRESAIICIESALRAGRVAPWLYDLLALQMKLAGRPPEDIGRVLQSRLDFGVSELPEMLMTAAMLSRFEAWDASLTLLRDAAELNPNRPETWLLARSVADKSGDPDQRIWPRLGILQWVWVTNWEREHEEAVKVLEGLAKELDAKQDSPKAAELRSRMAAARRRDLQIALRWVGNADLDLTIIDPQGEECSFRRPETSRFGRLVKQDGSLGAAAGRPAETHIEQFVQTQATPGNYQARIRFVGGKVASGTAVLEVLQHAGTSAESRKTHTIRIPTATRPNTAGTADTIIEIHLTPN
jgi:tetratricopeptide (TPR) repeat protein